jgi:hypothetical protein
LQVLGVVLLKQWSYDRRIEDRENDERGKNRRKRPNEDFGDSPDTDLLHGFHPPSVIAWLELETPTVLVT